MKFIVEILKTVVLILITAVAMLIIPIRVIMVFIDKQLVNIFLVLLDDDDR